MSTELVERVPGVGALIVVPEDPDRGFLTLRELRSKRSTHKVVGMLTLPMETVEPRENYAQAFERLTREEIQIENFRYDPRAIVRLCLCELRPGVVLHASILAVSPDADIIIGSESQEVADLRWTSFEDILNAPKGDLGIRPGTREVVQSYLEYRVNPTIYQPRAYGYDELHDRIPDEVFDLLEAGLSLEAALFRLKLASEPFARSVILGRSQPLQAVPLSSAGAI